MLDKGTAATDDCPMVRIPGGRQRIWLVASLLCCFATSLSLPAKTRAADCSSGPLIFVHGLGQDSSIFDHLIAGLAARGVPRDCLHALDYSDGNLAIAQAAEQELAPYVERLLAAHPASGAMSARVNLVGHSMGALSSRWYAARLRPDRVRTWISTSGANHGTNWKCPQPDGTGHGDMCPAFARNAGDSAVQIALNGGPEPDVDESPYGLGRDSAGAQHVAPDATRSILYLTVQVSRDPYIVPAASLRLDGAGGLTLQLPARAPWRELAPGNFRYTEPSGHDEVLRSDALVDFIYLAISATRPEPGATTSTSDSVHRTWHSPQSS